MGTILKILSKVWEIMEDQGAWHAIVYEVTKRWAHLSDSTITITMLNREPFKSISPFINSMCLLF